MITAPRPDGLSLAVAFDDERGIGRAGGLPWHHAADLRRFRSQTMGRTVIVGRRTLLSLPGPLPGRRIVVVSRTPLGGLHGCLQADDLAGAVSLAGPGRHVVAGGGAVYAEALPLVDEILLTRVPGRHGCDTFFPEFEADGWCCVARESGDGLTFERWTRV